MKSIINYTLKIQGLLSLFILAGLISLSSCSDDDNGSDKVELLSFGPSGVHHGDEITFFGENMDKVTAIVFAPNVEVSRSAFESATSQRINLIVPAAAEAGKVILKTPSGDIESITMLNLEVPVVITSITEEAKPGTNITITGEMLNWIERVTFASDLVVEKADFVSVDLDEVVITVPMEAQTGYLAFETGGTEPMSINSEEQLIVSLPEVTSLSPSSIKHTDNLTLSGTDLDLVTKIKFPSGANVFADEFESQSETEIVVAVPATATDGKLTLTVPSGLEVVTANSITIILPKVTAFNPSNTDDHDAGVTLTMTGTNLDLVGEIKFPGVSGAVTTFTKTATQIDVVIPVGVQGGTVVLTTIHGFTVPVTLPFGDQLVLAKVIFDESPKNGFGAWGGWGGTTDDFTNTENPRAGSVSIKATFGGDWGGAAQLGGTTLTTVGTAYFAFSIYGGAGTEGKEINVNVSGQQVQVVIKEGQWKDVQIALSSVGNPASISEVWFQDRGWSGTVYIDHIGLK